MSKLSIKNKINASADKVFKTLSEFKGVERYTPMVASSAVEGTGPGAKRTWSD